MVFVVKNAPVSIYNNNEKNCIILEINAWDDYHYKTSFIAYYSNDEGTLMEIGSIKIAKSGMQELERTPDLGLPVVFSKLPDAFYSLWQSAENYITVKKLEDTLGEKIFTSLNDIAIDGTAKYRYDTDEVCRISLFRFIPLATCTEQFHKIAIGGMNRVSYGFKYCYGATELEFKVVPDSLPPTNIHTIIASNGTGKTYMIHQMIRDICLPGSMKRIDFFSNDNEFKGFVEAMIISFSPFDNQNELQEIACDLYKERNLSIIGLVDDKVDEKDRQEKSLLERFETDFIIYLGACAVNNALRKDWLDIIEQLDADAMFDINKLKQLINEDGTFNKKQARELFSSLSSGHKVVLLILTSAVAKLAERTIVFMDEPENHLHPPLLSALISAMSQLLYKRNSVALVATHSPVVLQEVPRDCAWILYRSGNQMSAIRPTIQTFGANLGSLTNEVFKHEIRKTGFYKRIREVVNECETYEEVMNRFGSNIGYEGEAIVRILLGRKLNRN